MSTPRDILGRAYNKSSKSEPNRSMDDATEGLGLVNTKLRLFFALGARVNPLFFGVKEDLAKDGASGSWLLSALAHNPEIIFELKSGTTEVALVPFDDPAAEPGKPSVFYFGQALHPAGQTNDPTGALTVRYARAAQQAAGLDSALDAFWPEDFDELLVLEVALHLAVKDGRMEEVAQLRPHRDSWLKLYMMRLEHQTVIERRRKPLVRRFVTNSLVPLGSLLAGGTEVVTP